MATPILSNVDNVACWSKPRNCTSYCYSIVGDVTQNDGAGRQMLKAKARQCWPREQSTRDAKQLRASLLCARHKSQLSSERPTHCEPSPLLLSLYGKGFPKVSKQLAGSRVRTLWGWEKAVYTGRADLEDNALFAELCDAFRAVRGRQWCQNQLAAYIATCPPLSRRRYLVRGCCAQHHQKIIISVVCGSP